MNASHPHSRSRRGFSGLANAAVIAGPAVVVLLLGVLAHGMLRRTVDRSHSVERAERAVRVAEHLFLRLTEGEAAARGYLVAGEEAFLAPAAGAREDALGAVAELREVIRNPAQRARLEGLTPLVESKLAINDSIVALTRAGRVAEAEALVRSGAGRVAMERVRAAADEFAASQRRLRDARDAALHADVRRLTGTLAAATVLAVALALLTNLILARHARVEGELASEVEERNARLEETATELEAQTEELQHQAAHLEEAAAELEATNDELQLANAAIDAARAEADAANATKTEFLTTMSHELRTPLNAIAGYVDLLSLEVHGTVNQEQASALERIRRNQNHLLALITDILNFARVEVGQLDFQMEELPIEEVLSGLESMIEPQVRAAELTYACGGCDPALRAHADRERTEQILLNLLTNAVKFTPPGGRVEVSAATEGDRAVIRVRDTGRGIPEDKVQKIFDPFVQVDRHRSESSIQGVGLGLAISRGLAERMGGAVGVETAVGGGSTFTLALPLHRPAVPVDPAELLAG
jgi:signal transduction histidine kinase